MSNRIKLSAIKAMVRNGQAICINSAHDRSFIKGDYVEYAYSIGTNGVNGMLLKGDDGKYYAITCRCTALDIFGKH